MDYSYRFMMNPSIDLGLSHSRRLLVILLDIHIIILADFFVELLVIGTQPPLREGGTEPMLADPEPVDIVVDPAVAAVGGGHVVCGEGGEVAVHVADLVDAGLHLLLDGQRVDLLRLLC